MNDILGVAIVDDGGGGGTDMSRVDDGDPTLVCALDLSNEARRGVPSTEAGDDVGSVICLREGRETPHSTGGKCCNLSERQRAGGVAMVVTRGGTLGG